jgi:hypothetical protein
MIRKSVQRFSEKIMLKNKDLKRDVDSSTSHRALGAADETRMAARFLRIAADQQLN